MDAPLAGVLVADLTQNVAGPTCTQILGDMGADVIKVERPGRGDDARAWAPPLWGEESATFMSFNRSKRSLAVDMKAEDGRAVIAILGALRERERTGRGVNVTTALFETALAWTTFQMTHYFATGEIPQPQGSGTAMICPYEAFPTRDAWVMIAAGSDALFVKAATALGASELPRDARFADNPARVAHRGELFDALSRITRGLASAEVL